MTDTIFIGVAWPYANGDLHPGHLAGALLPADIFARYHRLRGNRVLLVSGSDAHGTPISVTADRAAIPPERLFRRYHRRTLDVLRRLGISFDLYTHTHTANHARTARTLFTRLYENGYIYSGTQQLLYAPRSDRFLPDRYVTGTCPHCGAVDARGDQCDGCGAVLESNGLLAPRSVLDDGPLELRESQVLFLDLPALQPRLEAFVEQNASHWRPGVANLVRAWLRDGLEPRAITRDLTWGIDVPLAGWEEKKLYIWFENIIGYLSAAIEWANRQGTPEAWRDFWYAPETRGYYFLGKDNIHFHTILWPAELLGAGVLHPEDEPARLNPPYDVPANQYLTFDDRQFSKSRGHGTALRDLLEQYSPDAIRYGVAAALPETRDADFSIAELERRHDTELGAAWGNLVHRVVTFTQRHFDGRVPAPAALRDEDRQLLEKVDRGFQQAGAHLEAVELRAALGVTFGLIRETNAYLDRSPWYRVIDEDRPAAAATIYTALNTIHRLNTQLAPFLPHAAEKIRRTLGLDIPLFGTLELAGSAEEDREVDALVYRPAGQANAWAPEELPAGHPLRPSRPLFPRLRSV